MKRAPFIAFAILSVCGISRVEADVAVPKGWTDTSLGEARVVSNGNATVVIQPWQPLGGQTAEEWLRGLEQRDPDWGRLLSSEGMKPEALKGAYSVTRHADFGGKKGYAILYACPGHAGEARLMTLDVRDGGFFDTLAGATFGETVCKESIAALPGRKKPAATVSQPAEETTSETADTDGKSPKKLNQSLADALRPTKAAFYTDWVWKGFPAIRTLQLSMVLDFPDGTRLACTDWSPDGSVSLKTLAQEKDCAIPKERSDEPIHGFTPGETLNVRFGNLAAFGIDGLQGSGSSLSGGDLIMTDNGEITLGEWTVGYLSSTARSARATGTSSQGLTGRYYLDGHTITIVTKEGEAVHGLIGYSTDDQGDVDTVFLNGKWYRDLKD